MKKATILVVDDEKAIAQLLRSRLERAGYNVILAYDGPAALNMVKSNRPDLILLDIMMPYMSGIEVKKELNRDPETAQIPTIFLTARNASQEKIEGIQLGANDYITKPFDGEELLARIEGILTKLKYYEKLSMTDGLTELHNVSFFKKQISLFFQLAQRHNKVFSLVICDVNDFKNINDSYGHTVGDFVLRTIADILKDVLRETDIITRYGGDEFVIILPETDEENGLKAIERIKERVNNHVFHNNDLNIDFKFSISCGIVTYNHSMTSEIDMFAQADNKLYEDKKNKANI